MSDEGRSNGDSGGTPPAPPAPTRRSATMAAVAPPGPPTIEGRSGGRGPLGPLIERVPEVLRGATAYHVPRPANVRAKLDANELPFALPPELRQRLGAVLAEASLERYPDANAAELRALMAARLGVSGEQLVFGNGSDELISMLCNALAAPRHGRPAAICYPVPTFVYYRLAADARGLIPVEVPLTARFELDEHALITAIERDDPSVVFLALPNNPTGGLWRHDIAVELAHRFPRTVIVSDEAYQAYSGTSNLPALGHTPNLVVMRTLSKVGMAGLRIGYLAASPGMAQLLEKVRPPYNLGSLPQAAARFLLTEAAQWCEARAADVVAARPHLAAALEARGFEVFPSSSNLLLVRTRAGRAHLLWKALQDRGVLVRDFDRPGPLLGCLRITVGTREDHQILLSALDEAMAEIP
jgi:histidinol-phosphate aminotransferase